jgi:hypothetical protein
MATKTTATALTVDALTGQETIRLLSAQELSAIQNSNDEFIATQEARIAARTSALAKLAELGLTAEEIAAL